MFLYELRERCAWGDRAGLHMPGDVDGQLQASDLSFFSPEFETTPE
jgi:hypothetical protein